MGDLSPEVPLPCATHEAWKRGAGILDAREELPREEDVFTSSPLWQLLAESLQFKLLFARAKRGNRHINIGELRAFLRSEALEAKRRPSHRGMFGLDSQVVLGAVLKGRSSSKSLNKELCQSLPTVLVYDWYSEGVYFETASNPADDPTRSREIRSPCRKLPGWWEALSNDDFEEFDKWMAEHGLDPYELSGLPPLEELMGDTAATSDNYTFAGGPLSEPSVSCEAKNYGLKPENELNSANDKLPEASLPHDELYDGETTTQLLELSEGVREALGQFPKSQVVFPTGSSRVWPPKSQGFLDLFSGARGVAKEFAKLTGRWVLCFDTEHREEEDLLDPKLQRTIEELVENKAFLGVGLAPVCASFSSAITPAVRTSAFPYGLPELGTSMQEKVRIGNVMALWCFSLVALALQLDLAVWLENPSSSWMFRLPEWRALQCRFPQLLYWMVDYCRFGTKWRKRTYFATNTVIGGYKTLCTRDHVHLLLRGRSSFHRRSWTAVAQVYPRGVARAVAFSMGISSKMIQWQGSFDPASCAKCGHMRIGEAGNPGPVLGGRDGRLEDIGLVEERTQFLQLQVWRDFGQWALQRISRAAWESALLFPMLLSVLLKEYGNHLYAAGKSLYVYRHLAVYVQQNVLGVRPYMGVVWDMVSRWEIAEPTEHAAPLPGPIFKAMLSLALQWRWYRFAGVLGLAFYGICRPGEVILAERKSLVLPSDMMHDSPRVAYLRIEKPKARRRGKGTVQHASIHEVDFIQFAEVVFGGLNGQVRLFPASSNSFRRRWDKLLEALKISSSMRLTPGGLRGGGAIHAFQEGADISRLMWRMRLKSLSTLESYLQEVVANTIMSDLTEEARFSVKAAATLAPYYLASVVARASP
eukprot:Skav214863  [mRNA]  locus=scaffold16:542655:545267:+ [translate_table: standard]